MPHARASREVIDELLSRPEPPVVRLHRASVDEAARIAALGARLFVGAHDGLMDADDIAAFVNESFGEAQQARELGAPDGATWVAESNDGQAVGLAQLRRAPLPIVDDARAGVEVVRLYVDRHSSGHRVMATLLATCVSEARAWETQLLWIGVWDKVPRTISFYQRLGLRVVGDREVTIGSDRQRELVLALPLA